ncbi:hypothetical protein TIFTF001_004437 [Ficus carica]|uniref:Uncharacterized protein n=1 Tax=Ficus carica TaxID=3494 RepID=A0AA87ZG59_FICCA|nr:hypothetical protein TIFTF001_004437 [Ficus carica]
MNERDTTRKEERYNPRTLPLRHALQLGMNALAEHCDVNIDAAFLLLSNRLDRSNPDDIDEISSNALKNFGDDTVFRLSPSTMAETEPALMTVETMTKMEAQAL